MHLYSLAKPEQQYDGTLKMQHNETTHLVLTISTALCGLYKTAFAVLIGKQHNIYTCAHTYTSCRSMRKTFEKQHGDFIRKQHDDFI